MLLRPLTGRSIYLPCITLCVIAWLAACSESDKKSDNTQSKTSNGTPAVPDLKARLDAEAKCKEAGIKLRTGAYSEARLLYEEALKLDPGNSSAKLGLSAPPGDPTKVSLAQQLNLQGEEQLRNGKILDSHRTFLRAHQIDPANFAIAENAAKTAWSIRRFEVSMRIADHLITLYPFDGAIRVKAAQAAYSAGNHERCLRYLQEADALVQADETLRTNPEMWFMRGIAAKHVELVPEAIDSFQKAIRLRPRHIPYINQLGGVYLNDGQYDLAIRTFNEILEIDPSDTYAPYHIGVVHDKQGNKNEAITWYKKSLQRDNTNWNACIKIARCFEALGGPENLNRAISYCDLALSKNELSHEAMFTLSNVYRKTGNDTQADRYFKKYESIMGVAKTQEDRIRVIKKELKINPDDLNLHLELVEIHVKFRHWDDAMDEVKEILIRDALHPKALAHSSRLFFIKEDYVAAYWEAHKLIESQPHSSEGYTLAAYSAMRQRRVDDAINLAEMAFARNSQDLGALEVLVESYRQRPGFEQKLAQILPIFQQLRAEEEEKIRLTREQYEREQKALIND